MIFSGHQPNFLPYMGVFYKMFQSDVFVLDDDVQYSNKGLHNKNFIMANGQKTEIVVPVKKEFGDRIRDVMIFYETNWQRKMLKSLQCSYAKAPHFEEVYPVIEWHIMNDYAFLYDMNKALLLEIAEKMGLKCRIVVASEDAPTAMKKNERNVYQCKYFGCNVYYSGVGGKDYNDEEMYAKEGIKVVYSDYQPTEYRQYGGKGRPFIPNLSVADYLFNNGFKIPEEWTKLAL